MNSCLDAITINYKGKDGNDPADHGALFKHLSKLLFPDQNMNVFINEGPQP